MGAKLKILKLEKCTSTNDVAREILDGQIESGYVRMKNDELPPDVIVANKQTKGRGLGDHTWWSPEDYGIYMSVIVKRKGPDNDWGWYTRAVGDRLVTTLRHHFQLQIFGHKINDVILDGRKLAGVLCEYHANTNKVIIGIGLNTFKPYKVRKDLLKTAVWLNEFASEYLIDHDTLVVKIANAMTTL